MPDIIDLLIADHKEVKAMLKKLTADKQPSDAEQIFDKLYASLKAHAKFEEASVYPLLAKKSATKDSALEAYEEHRQALALLEALHDMDDDDETCHAKLTVLSEDLNHHIKEEETTLLPQLKKTVAAKTLASLGETYQGIKDKLQQEQEEAPARREPVRSR
jgi:iron-sulfur cluster repair protein YtfE (RIC family)